MNTKMITGKKSNLVHKYIITLKYFSECHTFQFNLKYLDQYGTMSAQSHMGCCYKLQNWNGFITNELHAIKTLSCLGQVF